MPSMAAIPVPVARRSPAPRRAALPMVKVDQITAGTGGRNSAGGTLRNGYLRRGFLAAADKPSRQASLKASAGDLMPTPERPRPGSQNSSCCGACCGAALYCEGSPGAPPAGPEDDIPPATVCGISAPTTRRTAGARSRRSTAVARQAAWPRSAAPGGEPRPGRAGRCRSRTTPAARTACVPLVHAADHDLRQVRRADHVHDAGDDGRMPTIIRTITDHALLDEVLDHAVLMIHLLAEVNDLLIPTHAAVTVVAPTAISSGHRPLTLPGSRPGQAWPCRAP